MPTIDGDFGGALGPMGTNDSKLLIDFPAKESVFWMYPAAQLISEAARRKESDTNLACFKHPTLPSNPHIEVKDYGRIGERDHF